MTRQKKLKKAIRARSEKTGESYTAARRQVLLARDKKAAEPAVAPEPTPADAAVITVEPAPAAPPLRRATPTKGGISEKSVREKTGHGLDHWFAVLDAFGAATKGHTATAAHLHEAHGVPGWHSQGITVAYERERGLRAVNQTCSGTFQVSVSKTVPATVAEVAEALRSPERRAAWLAGADPALAQALDAAFTGEKPREVKTKANGDQAWLRFRLEGRTVEIRVLAKPKGATVVADNQDLAGTEQVEQRRAQWRTALEGLHRHLSA